MVDTGATISFIPECGDILKAIKPQFEKANLVIQLATGAEEHVNKKVKVFFRPSNSNDTPKMIHMYVQDNAKEICGYQALIGLKHLKLFDMDIISRNGKVRIYHQNQVIGCETNVDNNSKATIKVIDKFDPNIVQDDLQKILNRYKAVFTDLDGKPMSGEPMRFPTIHQRPIYAKQRHYTAEEIIAMRQHIKDLLDRGIIERTTSGYAAASRIIPKKNGTGRLVINYIPLNAVTYRDSYVTPHISDILQAIQGQVYFSTLDCTQGFYQIEVDWKDRHKTAFSTPVGNYQFRRCPFGARNSGAKFQAEMNRIFFDGLYTRCIIYVDDILVMGRTLEEHHENLDWVLKRALEHHVKIKLEKCIFAKREVQYLGFIISGNQVKPVPDKVDSLSKMKSPRDKTELRSAIGKLNFYSRFIKNYSKLFEPLRILLTKNKDYQWTNNHQKAYDSMISQLTKFDVQLLVSRNEYKSVVLHTIDDSIEVLLLTQEGKLITRASRLLSTSETNYNFIEKQLLALTFAMDRFKLLLIPERFKVVVPNNDLMKVITMINKPDRVDRILIKMPAGFDTFTFEVDTNLKSTKTKTIKSHVAQEIFYIDGACRANGKPECRASWAVCAEYDKSIEVTGYVTEKPSNQSAELTAAIEACKIARSKGYTEFTIVTDSKYLFSAATLWIDKWKNNQWKDNKNKPVIHIALFKQLLYAKQGLHIEWQHVKGHGDNQGNIRADLLAKSLLDSKAAMLNSITTDGKSIQPNDEEILSLKEHIYYDDPKNLTLIDNTVYFIDNKLPEDSQLRIYVPRQSRNLLLKLSHDDIMYGGHLGIKKTYRKLIRFWWPKMHNDVESYVKSCDTCQRFKNPAGMPPGYLHSIPISDAFEHIHIDIVGPLKTTFSGSKYVITATDAFTKWLFAKPSQGIRTSELIQFVEDSILSVHGKPKRIITDRGTQFTSSEWIEFIQSLDIEHKLTSAYHPQSNGIDERVNGTLMRILRPYVDRFHEKWDHHLKWAVYIYNTTVHESTGYSPYQLLHGMDARSPLKPENTPINLNEIDLILHRDRIRNDARDRIRDSQANQKHYYDKHRSDCKLYIGQSVFIKVNAPPTHLHRKFHVKWDGPFIITSFVGNNTNPRAVTVFDIESRIKKVVAIDQVKPAISSFKDYDNIDPNLKKGDGRIVDEPTCSQMFSDASYYVECNNNDNNNSDKNINPANDSTEVYYDTQTDSSRSNTNSVDNDKRQHDTELDITQRTTSGPLSSSPKRVRISEQIQEYTYFPNEPSCDETTDSTIINMNIQNEAVTDPKTNDSTGTSTPEESIEEQLTPLPEIDDVKKDPPYKPPSSLLRREKNTPSTSSDNPERNLSTNSLIPRYTLRSNNNKDTQSIETTTNESTNIERNVQSTTGSQRAIQSDHLDKDTMEDKDTSKERTALLIALPEDNILNHLKRLLLAA